MTDDVDIGLQGAAAEASPAPMPVMNVEDLAAARTAWLAAGARMVRPTFAFPGRRRFHFRDPHGHEPAVMQGC